MYIPETRRICKTTIGSKIEKKLEAGMIAKALVSEKNRGSLDKWNKIA